MMMTRPVAPGRVSRRAFVGQAAVLACESNLVGMQNAAALAADPDCPRCGGLGRVPRLDAKPFVWMKGAQLPKADEAVGEEPCPLCQSSAGKDTLVSEAKGWIDDAIAKNKQWEERCNFKLGCVVTRHATIHTQLATDKARAVGMALEVLTLHLKRITGSLLLTSSKPDTLELMLLWEKPSWDKFRKVMEGMYTLQQLGPSWTAAQQFNAYDHIVTPHMYETQQSSRARPPSCGAVFIVGRRQLNLAADWHTPFWLAEGFAAYCDHAVHKVNRWYTVYDVKQIPAGDWIAEARKVAGESKLRPWNEMMKRELRDWEAVDHVQTTAMAAFLFESEPAKFVNLLKQLKRGETPVAALEEAYRTTIEDLEGRCSRWLLARR